MIPDYIGIDRLKIPHNTGVYIFKDEENKVLYIGKAIDLYHRIASYFGGSKDPKTTDLVKNIKKLDTIIVESELEALILEANLIKKYLPPYNIRLTDDKDYLYIAMTKGDFPNIVTARRKDLKSVKDWFGPFPSAQTAKTTLRKLRRVFPWCSKPPKTYFQSRIVNTIPNRNWKSRACFYYHLDLCPGACAGKISKEGYTKIISRFSQFLSGQKQELLNKLTGEMRALAKDEKFEEAQKIKKIIFGINYLTQPNRIVKYLENSNFLEQESLQALHDLQKDLNLDSLPERIEAYDISNMQGKEATGSMVVLTNGEIDRSQYRRFKIRISGKPNDVGMHKEMLRRRLNHKDWSLPQLILVDGGRGQSNAIATLCLQKGFNIPIYGLAKRFEWLYPPEGEVVKLPKRSLSLRLLQKIRDESHRFAITYHKKLREKTFWSMKKAG